MTLNSTLKIEHLHDLNFDERNYSENTKFHSLD